MEVSEAEESEDERSAAELAVVAGFGEALKGLAEMRRTEGQALGKILVGAAFGNRRASPPAPRRRPGASPRRSRRGWPRRWPSWKASQRFDADRLHQEAIMLATKIDIREELDRLTAHVAQAKKLLADGGPIGRKLDFLSQELNRESNTLCSKANDLELTNIGLELKAVVEQFREQVQNLE